MDDTLLIALIVVVFNGAFDAFVVAWIAGKRSKQALLKALQYPDEETEDAIFNLLDMSWSWLTDQNKMAQMWNWVMTSQIETGNVIKTTNDAGEETSTKETITPFISICRGISQYVKMTVLGKSGGDKAKEQEFMRAVAADLQDPNNPLGGVMRSALPSALLKAQKTGDYGPIIQLVLGNYLGDWLKKRQAQPPQQHGPNTGGQLGF
jgi:hypothetical protein